MSGALDTMSDAELAELRQMQADDAATETDDAPAVVETPSAEAQPAATETPAAEPTQEPKQVPQQALHQERDRRKKLEAQLAEQGAKHAADLARVQERLDLLTRA